MSATVDAVASRGHAALETDDTRVAGAADGPEAWETDDTAVAGAAGQGGTRLRGDNGVSPAPGAGVRVEDRPSHRPVRAAAPLTRRPPRRTAALEWQDLNLPFVGRLRARAWLPSILLAACLVSLMYLLQTSGVATTGYDIQRLQVERDDWQLRNEQLRLELAKRRSLTWIEAEATGRLGMVRAEPTALTYLKITR